MIHRTRVKVIILIVLGAFTALLAACGSSNAAPTSAQVAPPNDTTCFTQMTTDQKAQLTSYINQTGGTLNNTSNNPDGTQDVCVLEPDGNNGYREHYYRQGDSGIDASTLAMYYFMGGRSSSLATYALISGSGNLDAGDLLTLSLLDSIRNDGSVYHPYSYNAQNGSWNRQPTVVNNYHITHVRYGNAADLTPQQAKATAPPKGYAATPLPASTNQTATVTKGANGKSSVTSSGTAVQTNKSVTTGGSGITNPKADTVGGTTAKPAPKPAPKPAIKPSSSPSKSTKKG